MKPDFIFGLFLVGMVMFLALFLVPIVWESGDGVDTTGWPTFLIAMKENLPLVFVVLVPFCALSAIWWLKKEE